MLAEISIEIEVARASMELSMSSFDNRIAVDEDLTATYAVDCGWRQGLDGCYNGHFDMLVIDL